MCNKTYKCIICKKDPFILGQYFMVHNELWNSICSNNNLSKRSLICKDCFEQLLGRRLREDDLTNCSLNNDYKRYILNYE